MNYGVGYKYSHDFPENFAYQEFMPAEISKNTLYEPQDNIREKEFQKKLENLWGKKYDYN